MGVIVVTGQPAVLGSPRLGRWALCGPATPTHTDKKSCSESVGHAGVRRGGGAGGTAREVTGTGQGGGSQATL